MRIAALALALTLAACGQSEPPPPLPETTVQAVAAPWFICDAINAPVIGRGVVLPQQMDLTGRMMPEFFIGRVSDSIAHLLRPWREKVAAEAGAELARARATSAAAAISALDGTQP